MNTNQGSPSLWRKPVVLMGGGLLLALLVGAILWNYSGLGLKGDITDDTASVDTLDTTADTASTGDTTSDVTTIEDVAVPVDDVNVDETTGAMTCDPRVDIRKPDGTAFNPFVATTVVINGLSASIQAKNFSPSCTYTVGFVSYKVSSPWGTPEFVSTQQKFADIHPVSFLPGETKTFSVALPNCAYQVDFYEGATAAPQTNPDFTQLPNTLFDWKALHTPLCAADVGITKSAHRHDIEPNGLVVYTLNISNTGQLTAENVVVVDDYDQTRFLPNSTLYPLPPQCTNDNTQGKITCTLGTLTVGQTVTLMYGMKALNNLGQAVNIARVTTTTQETNLANNEATETVTIVASPPANPTCSNFQASPATILVGGSSTLSWSSTNGASASIDNGVGTVALTGTKSVTPAQTTTYTLTITGVAGTTPANCQTTVVVTSNPAINFSLDKTASPENPQNGEAVTYTIVLRNNGSTFANVFLTDEMALGTNGGSMGGVFGENVACDGNTTWSGTLTQKGITFVNVTPANSCRVTYQRLANTQGIPEGKISDFTNTAKLFSCGPQAETTAKQ